MSNYVKDLPEYKSWTQMNYRCTNPKSHNYARYGGRGIKVCKEWYISFKTFLKDIGNKPSPEHTIERINNDDDYKPGNVRWATKEEQANNRCTNVRYTYANQNLTLVEWSSKVNINVTTLARRLELGWSLEKTLITPVKFYKTRRVNA